MRGALNFVELLEEDGPRLVPASYVTTGSHSTFEHTVRTRGRAQTSSSLLCSLLSDALGLPQEAYLNFPRTRKWEVATSHHRKRFAAYAIQSRDILLHLSNRRLYIRLHVQEFLAGLHVEWGERLTRLTLGVRRALEAGDALPAFPPAIADTLEAVDLGLEGDPLIMGRNGQGGTDGGDIENCQTTRNRDDTSKRQAGTQITREPFL